MSGIKWDIFELDLKLRQRIRPKISYQEFDQKLTQMWAQMLANKSTVVWNKPKESVKVSELFATHNRDNFHNITVSDISSTSSKSHQMKNQPIMTSTPRTGDKETERKANDSRVSIETIPDISHIDQTVQEEESEKSVIESEHEEYDNDIQTSNSVKSIESMTTQTSDLSGEKSICIETFDDNQDFGSVSTTESVKQTPKPVEDIVTVIETEEQIQQNKNITPVKKQNIVKKDRKLEFSTDNRLISSSESSQQKNKPNRACIRTGNKQTKRKVDHSVSIGTMSHMRDVSYQTVQSIFETSPETSPFIPNTIIKMKNKKQINKTLNNNNTTVFGDNHTDGPLKSSTTQTIESIKLMTTQTSDPSEEKSISNETFDDNQDFGSVSTAESVKQTPKPVEDIETVIETEEQLQQNKNITPVKKQNIVKKRKKLEFLNDITNEIIRPSISEENDSNQLRRSERKRINPLEYWRGERIVYKRDSTGVQHMVSIQKGGNVEINRRNTNKGSKRKRIDRDSTDNNRPTLDISVHNSQWQSLTKQNNKNKCVYQNLNCIKFLDDYEWKKSERCDDIATAMITKSRERGQALGILKLGPMAKKSKSTTGDYVTHFTVTHGALVLKIDSNPEVILKTGSYFQIGKQVTYSLENCRNDIAYISFTVLKD